MSKWKSTKHILVCHYHSSTIVKGPNNEKQKSSMLVSDNPFEVLNFEKLLLTKMKHYTVLEHFFLTTTLKLKKKGSMNDLHTYLLFGFYDLSLFLVFDSKYFFKYLHAVDMCQSIFSGLPFCTGFSNCSISKLTILGPYIGSNFKSFSMY